MTTVRIPRPEDDHMPWGTTLAAGVLGLILGLAVAWWGMERDRSEEGHAETAAEPETEPVPVPQPAPLPEVAADSEPGVARYLESEVLRDSEPEIARDPPASPPTVELGPASGLVLRPGRVAYLRCDGVPPVAGPFPCPRDEALETSVWSRLAALVRCPGLDRPGSADVVVDFDGAETPTIRVRDTFGADVVRLDAQALTACTSALSEVRTSLRPRRLVVSFRFALSPSR